MSSIGVRWHRSQKINAQIAASEIAVFEIATKYCFMQNMVKMLLLFTRFDRIKRKKLMEHTLSLTERVWKQLVLLHKAFFLHRTNFPPCFRIKHC